MVVSDIAVVVWVLMVLLSSSFDWRSNSALVVLSGIGVVWSVGVIMYIVKMQSLGSKQRRNAIVNIIITFLLVVISLVSMITLHRLDSQNLTSGEINCRDLTNESGVVVSECD